MPSSMESSVTTIVKSPRSSRSKSKTPKQPATPTLTSASLSSEPIQYSTVRQVGSQPALQKKRAVATETSFVEHRGSLYETNDIKYVPPIAPDILDSPYPAHMAAQRGDLESLQGLFASGRANSMNDADDGRDTLTVAHWAALEGHPEMLRWILWNGGNENCETTTNGWSPLQLAAIRGNADCVQVLLVHGANVAQRDQRGSIALHKAALHGRINALRRLLHGSPEAHLLLDEPDSAGDGWTATHYAAFNGQLASIVQLVSSGAIVNVGARSNSATPLHLAIAGEHADVVLYLLRHGAHSHVMNAQRETPVALAERLQSDACLRVFQDFDEEAYDEHRFAGLDNLRIGGPSLDDDDTTVTEKDLIRLPEFLKDDNASFPAHHAAYCNHLGALQTYLHDSTAYPVNAIDADGNTPLHRACAQGHDGIVEWLINYTDADTRIRNSRGETALDVARRYGHGERLKAAMDRAREARQTREKTDAVRRERERKEREEPSEHEVYAKEQAERRARVEKELEDQRRAYEEERDRLMGEIRSLRGELEREKTQMEGEREKSDSERKWNQELLDTERVRRERMESRLEELYEKMSTMETTVTTGRRAPRHSSTGLDGGGAGAARRTPSGLRKGVVMTRSLERKMSITGHH